MLSAETPSSSFNVKKLSMFNIKAATSASMLFSLAVAIRSQLLPVCLLLGLLRAVYSSCLLLSDDD